MRPVSIAPPTNDNEAMIIRDGTRELFGADWCEDGSDLTGATLTEPGESRETCTAARPRVAPMLSVQVDESAHPSTSWGFDPVLAMLAGVSTERPCAIA